MASPQPEAVVNASHGDGIRRSIAESKAFCSSAEMDLPSGKYKITLEAASGVPQNREFDVAAGQDLGPAGRSARRPAPVRFTGTRILLVHRKARDRRQLSCLIHDQPALLAGRPKCSAKLAGLLPDVLYLVLRPQARERDIVRGP